VSELQVPPAPTLLIVDDEVRILSALRRALRREGYLILTASTPAEGLKRLDEQRVDAVLTDHKMPQMSGLELLTAVSERRPEVARLLITGWPEAIPADRISAIGIRALIPKPWEDEQLKKILREALRTPSASAITP
jgi:DNA-binding NtrC family response regulator